MSSPLDHRIYSSFPLFFSPPFLHSQLLQQAKNGDDVLCQTGWRSGWLLCNPDLPADARDMTSVKDLGCVGSSGAPLTGMNKRHRKYPIVDTLFA
jgi:hypothetical protein